MEKKIEDYLPYYLGADVLFNGINARLFSASIWKERQEVYLKDEAVDCDLHNNELKLLLRKLSSITEDELVDIIQLSYPENLLDKPNIYDYDLEVFYNDDGNMVDGDVAIGANYTCICYTGQIAIRKCGSIHFFNEDGALEMYYNTPKVYQYLLSKHFDLFGLIESGLAIDKTLQTA